VPKVVYVPPPIPKEEIGPEGAVVTVTAARIIRNQWTSIGTCKLGLGLTVELNGEEYSAMFSLDRDILTGSIGRILDDAGFEEINENVTDEDVQVLVGKHYVIRKRGGKLYWYPKKA